MGIGFNSEQELDNGREWSLGEEIHNVLGIFIAIEEYFNIQIKDVEAQEVETFNDLVELVRKKKAENGSRL
ncbi:hypothetical protein UFOVP54_12 [uncultured Caudovirales phage]|uniref:Uncharacterized protein n=1 Tax=uncultured Caudovirales phage TaxID=2100421 RepID=A0A6J5KRR0_9CAUD|nr:hypothetical protein UFOVP54_12 [uncultured Caudovirales phage]